MSDSNHDLNDLKVQWKVQSENEEYESVAESIVRALKEHGSDSVRDALQGIRNFDFYLIGLCLIKFFKGELSGKNDSEKIEYVYDVPFFCRTREMEMPAKSNMRSRRMPVDVTSIERACLKKFIHFQIHFDQFDVNEEQPELVESDLASYRLDEK